MPAGFDGELDKMWDTIREQQSQLQDVQRAVDAATATATSRDRSVAATVDGFGNVTSVQFSGTRYRSMPPTELGVLVVETIAAARRQIESQVSEIYRPLLPEAADLGAASTGRVDVAQMFREAMDEVGLGEYLDPEQHGRPGQSGQYQE
ncbi:YbaB/EbfC family nucleoid-associated protein [Actinoplanes sp. NPDC051859]|uniref:YbaB/EbfC family nucleoid-associated protein n=1 Tax=Actinoplanes sp. NPDC051859 TaxID=3363909 RepID=UPI0037B0480D